MPYYSSVRTIYSQLMESVDKEEECAEFNISDYLPEGETDIYFENSREYTFCISSRKSLSPLHSEDLISIPEKSYHDSEDKDEISEMESIPNKDNLNAEQSPEISVNPYQNDRESVR